MPGYLGPDWHRRAPRVLTGNSQLAINWQRVATITGDDSLRLNAAAASRFNMATQYLDHTDPGIRGGIKGSHPVDGDYMTDRLPNWAAKFFMDSLMQSATVPRRHPQHRGLTSRHQVLGMASNWAGIDLETQQVFLC